MVPYSKTVTGTFVGYWEDQHSQLIIISDNENGSTKDYRISPQIVQNSEHNDPLKHLIAQHGTVRIIETHDYGTIFNPRETELNFFMRYWRKPVALSLDKTDRVIAIMEGAPHE